MNIIEQNKEKINGILETFDRITYVEFTWLLKYQFLKVTQQYTKQLAIITRK